MYEECKMEIDIFGNVIVEEQSFEEVKPQKPSPFEFTKSISSKNYPQTLEGFSPWLTNSSFSQRKDTVMYANEMNRYHQLSDKEQFDFYFHAMPKGNYFAKWAKEVKSKYSDAIMWYFDVSYKVAKQYEKVLKKDQMESILKIHEKREGGK